MAFWNWKMWQVSSARSTARRGSVKRRIEFDTLEERTVPATLDLTTRGAMGAAGDGLFRQIDSQPTGTGVIDSFVRLQTNGAKAAVAQGYNTDARPLQFDENNSRQFTRSLQVSDLPQVNIGGNLYREFLLDINQKASQPYLSLDELRIYTATTGNLTGYNATTKTLAGHAATFDLDADGDNWIKLDTRLNQGSGKGDMLAYIPESAFAGADPDSYVYLYSKFGVNFMPNAGFEEWAVSESSLTSICGAISGTVVNAATGLGVPDVTVYLDGNRNGVLDGNDVYTTTDSFGFYEFDNLATGLGDFSNYLVGIVPPEDWQADPVSQYVYLDTCGLRSHIDFTIEFDGEEPPPA